MSTVNELEPGQFVITLEKTFDFESHKAFREAVKDVMGKNPQSLKLDFGQVEYLDSSGLGMLMLAKHEADARGCNVTISNLKDGHARKVIELVRFDQMFTVEYA